MSDDTTPEELDYSLEATLEKLGDKYPTTRELLEHLIAARTGDGMLESSRVSGALVGAIIDLESRIMDQQLDLDDLRIRFDEVADRL